jgi:hypothetical protein
LLDVTADQRLAPGQSDLANAHPGQQTHETEDLVEPQDLLPGLAADALGRHAVDATQVAAVRDGDAQVRMPATLAIDQVGQVLCARGTLRLPVASGHASTCPWFIYQHRDAGVKAVQAGSDSESPNYGTLIRE